MRSAINHPTHGVIICEESFWTGKKSLIVNGFLANRISRKEFELNGKTYLLKGSVYTGLTMTVDGEIIVLAPRPKWYEFVLFILPIVFMLTWGNSVELCSIFPVVGGALGGVLGALFGCASLSLMKRSDRPLGKILIGLGLFAASVATSFVLAIMIILLIA